MNTTTDAGIAPSTLHKRLFGIGAFFAIWVANFCYVEHWLGFNPGLPFDAPPLHERTIASLYVCGAVMMFLAARAPRMSMVRIPTVIAGLFTSTLLLASLLNLHMFEFGIPDQKPGPWGMDWLRPRFQVDWFWFALYGLCPILVIRLIRQYWAAPGAVRHDPLSLVLRLGLWVIALGGGAFALTLFIAPGFGVGLWPWRVTPFLAQIYAGPMLAFAVAAGMMAMAPDRRDTFIPAAGLVCFAVLAIAASLWYLHILQPLGSAAWGWLTGLGYILLVAGASLATAKRT